MIWGIFGMEGATLAQVRPYERCTRDHECLTRDWEDCLKQDLHDLGDFRDGRGDAGTGAPA